jgi:hypothetical protein
MEDQIDPLKKQKQNKKMEKQKNENNGEVNMRSRLGNMKS